MVDASKNVNKEDGSESINTENRQRNQDVSGNQPGIAGVPGITGVTQSNKKVSFVDTIVTIAKSRDRFSTRDQIRADKVRRLQ